MRHHRPRRHPKNRKSWPLAHKSVAGVNTKMSNKSRAKADSEKKSQLENFSGGRELIEEQADLLLPTPPQVMNTLAPPDGPPPPKKPKK